MLRPIILCVAMAAMVFALYRRDWTRMETAPAYQFDSRHYEPDFPSIDVGLRDYRVYDHSQDRIEELNELFLGEGHEVEAAGRRAFYAGWAALVACAIAAGLFLRGRPSVSARVALCVPLLASAWTALAYSGWLGEKLHSFQIGTCAYLVPLAVVAAAAAIVWPRSSRSRSPGETLPQARATDRSPARADADRAPSAPNA